MLELMYLYTLNVGIAASTAWSINTSCGASLTRHSRCLPCHHTTPRTVYVKWPRIYCTIPSSFFLQYYIYPNSTYFFHKSMCTVKDNALPQLTGTKWYVYRTVYLFLHSFKFNPFFLRRKFTMLILYSAFLKPSPPVEHPPSPPPPPMPVVLDLFRTFSEGSITCRTDMLNESCSLPVLACHPRNYTRSWPQSCTKPSRIAAFAPYCCHLKSLFPSFLHTQTCLSSSLSMPCQACKSHEMLWPAPFPIAFIVVVSCHRVNPIPYCSFLSLPKDKKMHFTPLSHQHHWILQNLLAFNQKDMRLPYLVKVSPCSLYQRSSQTQIRKENNEKLYLNALHRPRVHYTSPQFSWK